MLAKCWELPKNVPKNLMEKRLLYINAPKFWENHGIIVFEDLWKSPNDSWWRLIAVRIDSINLNVSCHPLEYCLTEMAMNLMVNDLSLDV